MKGYLGDKPFKRGDLIVITTDRRIDIGMLWGRGGESRITIQYFNKWRVKRLAKAVENLGSCDTNYPSITYADSHKTHGYSVDAWRWKMAHYHRDCLSNEFRDKFDTLVSHIAQRYKLETLFAYE